MTRIGSSSSRHATPIQHDASVPAQQNNVDKSDVPPLPPFPYGDSNSAGALIQNSANTGNANDAVAKSSSTLKPPSASSTGRKLERRSSWTAGSPDRQKAGDSGNNNEEKHDMNDGTGRRPSVAGGVAAMMAKFGQN